MGRFKGIIRESHEEITAWFPYRHGIEYEFGFIDRRELKALTGKSKSRKFVNHQPVEEVDDDKLGDAIIETVFKGWKGMTFRALEKLIPVRADRVENWDEELPPDLEDMKMLLDRVVGLGSFVFNSVTDLANFVADREASELGE